MPPGTGYWLHNSGKSVRVFEHLNEVLTNPRTFGITQTQLARRRGEDDSDYRERILRAVMEKGWTRVRESHGSTVFEYWKLNRRLADTIWEFAVDTVGAGPFSTLYMNEVTTGRNFSAPAGQFFEAIDTQLGGWRPRHDGGTQLYLAGLAVGQGQ